MNKASSLALLLGALAAAVAFTPASWKRGPEPAQQASRVMAPPVVVEARVGKPTETAEPPKDVEPTLPETTTIVLPSRSAREEPRGSFQSYKGDEPLRLVRDLQRELKRAGCYAYEIDGSWTPGTRRAMKDFAERVNVALSVERPDAAQLALLQRHPQVVCRETCRGGDLADSRCLPSSQAALEGKKAVTATPGLQITWTKSYVTPAAPEPETAEAAPPAAELTPRVDPPPRPRRQTSRQGGVGSFLFGIFSW